MDPQHLVYVFLAVVFVVVASAGVSQVIKARRTQSAMAQWARANGWTYQGLDNSQLRPGAPFSPIGHGFCRDVVSGAAANLSFVAFEYHAPETITDGTNKVHQSAVAVIKLPQFLPSLEVRPEGLAARSLPHINQTDTVVELESSDFNNKFRVAASPPKFASDILTPLLMEYLLTAPKVFWRIWGNDLLGWTPGPISSGQTLQILSVLTQVQRHIPTFIWEMYGSQASAAFTPSGSGTPVTASGPQQAPAGWYVDPSNAQQARWWDGTAWTPQIGSVHQR